MRKIIISHNKKESFGNNLLLCFNNIFFSFPGKPFINSTRQSLDYFRDENSRIFPRHLKLFHGIPPANANFIPITIEVEVL